MLPPPPRSTLFPYTTLLLRPHDALQRRIPRLVEPLLRREDGGQGQVEDLEPALDLARGPSGLAVAVDRRFHDPGGARPAEQLGELGRDGAHVIVDRLPPAEDEPGRLP